MLKNPIFCNSHFTFIKTDFLQRSVRPVDNNWKLNYPMRLLNMPSCSRQIFFLHRPFFKLFSEVRLSGRCPCKNNNSWRIHVQSMNQQGPKIEPDGGPRETKLEVLPACGTALPQRSQNHRWFEFWGARWSKRCRKCNQTETLMDLIASAKIKTYMWQE